MKSNQRHKFHVVRYEDLVQYPRENLEQIFNYLNISEDNSDLINLSMAKHSRIKKADAENETKLNFEFKKKTLAYLKEYYGTIRQKSFDPDHWKKEMTPELLKEILEDSECSKALKLLNYNE